MKLKDDFAKYHYRFNNADVPNLQNNKIEKDLKEGLEFINAAYNYKINILQKYLKLVEDPQSIIKIAEIKNDSEKYQQLLIGGIARMMAVVFELGIKELPKTQP